MYMYLWERGVATMRQCLKSWPSVVCLRSSSQYSRHNSISHKDHTSVQYGTPECEVHDMMLEKARVRRNRKMPKSQRNPFNSQSTTESKPVVCKEESVPVTTPVIFI